MVEDTVDEPGPGSSPSCAASHVGPSLRAANMAKELGTFCTSGPSGGLWRAQGSMFG